jgi:hypothetical protein
MNEEQKMKAAVEIMKAVASAIKGLGTIPSGHLYAQLMGRMSLDSYEKMLSALQRMGIVSIDGNHLVTYIGK